MGSASAATITVTTTAEDPFANSTACSLREAIIAANRHTPEGGCPAGDAGGENTIALQAGATYTLTQPDSPAEPPNYDRGSWYGPNGLPPIASRVVIEGNGATIARSQYAAPFRLFFVGAGGGVTSPNHTYTAPAPGPGVLTLRDITLEGGWAKGGDSNGNGGGAGLGGAIFNQGTLVLDHSTLTGNAAQGGSAIDPYAGFSGGGIGTNSVDAPAPLGAGGGFGLGNYGGAGGGAGASSGGGDGGGAGFTPSEPGGPGGPGSGPNGGNGGGPQTGLGGAGSPITGVPGIGGDGGGGGASGFGDVAGGSFGSGGQDGGGGGGVGGGGGQLRGGGGFGGGGGGSGGFGGGAGGAAGSPGFGGGTRSNGQGGGGAGMGGAIFNMQGLLTIIDSTLTGNVAQGGADIVPDPGKGIAGAVFNLSGSFTAVDSTFARNTAAYYASQIFNLVADEATARTAQTTLENTIVADGTGGNNPSTTPSFATSDVTSDQTNYPGPNKAGASATVDESAFDLVTASQTMELGTLTGAPLTADPLLGTLAGNGGPTQTLLPQSASPVIDAGSAVGLTTDQRGLPRPFDFPGVANAGGGDGSDIGAVEVQPACSGQTSPSQGCGGSGGSSGGPTGPAGPTGGQGPTGPSGPLAPVLSSVHQTHAVWVEGKAPAKISRKRAHRHPVGTVFSFRLNETDSVRFAFQRAVAGRKFRGHCVASSKRNRKGRRCTRLVPAGALAFTGHTGTNKVAFQGRLTPRTRLKLGSYTLVITATSPTGQRAIPQTLRFEIVSR